MYMLYCNKIQKEVKWIPFLPCMSLNKMSVEYFKLKLHKNVKYQTFILTE